MRTNCGTRWRAGRIAPSPPSPRGNTASSLFDSSKRAGSARRDPSGELSAGRLQRLWRGVYAFGHSELRPEGRLLGAVFACGPGAVLSHRSAANRWGILATARAKIDVTVATRGRRPKRPGIDLHCVRRLDRARRHHPRRHPDHHRRAHPGRPLRGRPAPNDRASAGAVLRAAVDRARRDRGRPGASRGRKTAALRSLLARETRRRPSPAASSRRHSSPYAAVAACPTPR